MTGPRPAALTVTKTRETHGIKPCTLIGDCPSPRSIRVAGLRRGPRRPSRAPGPSSRRPSPRAPVLSPGHPSGGHLPV